MNIDDQVRRFQAAQDTLDECQELTDRWLEAEKPLPKKSEDNDDICLNGWLTAFGQS